jgi:hypothetical protein
MKWSYLLVFTDQFMSYDEAKHFLNARDDVTEWLHVFDNLFILAASTAGTQLGDAVLAYAKKNQNRDKPEGLFLLTEATDDRNGWLPKAAWNLLNDQTTTPPKSTPIALTSIADDVEEEEIPF